MESRERLAKMRDRLAEQTSLMNVEELLTDFNWKTSGNAAALEKRLLGELAALEAFVSAFVRCFLRAADLVVPFPLLNTIVTQANVHAIIQTDERVEQVIAQIDSAMDELDNMDTWLTLYSAELNSMGDDIHQIESQNRGLQVQTANQRGLITELENLLRSITVSERVTDALKQDSLEHVAGITKIEDSASQLQKVLQCKLEDGLQTMKVVQERMELYNIHSNNFSTRVYEYLKIIFQFQADALLNDKQRVPPSAPTRGAKGILRLPPHDMSEDYLIKYRGLTLWMKEMDPRRYNELQMLYSQAMTKPYKRDFKELIDTARQYYSALRRDKGDDIDYLFKANDERPTRGLGYSQSIKAHGRDEASGMRRMLRGSIDGSPGSRAGTVDEDDDAFSQSIAQVVPLMVREQNFLGDLFHLGPGAPRSFQDRGKVLARIEDKEELMAKREAIKDVKVQKRVLIFNSSQVCFLFVLFPDPSELMETIFEGLPSDLSSFVDSGTRTDATHAVNMLVAVENQLEDLTGSDQAYVISMLNSLDRKLVNIFEKFVEEQLRAIEETKITSKKRKGILPFVRTFPLFAVRLETALAPASEDSHSRRLVDAAYEKVVKTMFDSLEAIAKESDQTGDDKEQLNVHIMTIGRWQYRVDEFFEGVDNAIKTAAPEEVGYQMAYNKAQLRKVLSQFPAKEIKKSLENLYKRVDKHFSEEEGLLQVVWRGIQEEFIQQHEKMEFLIRKCYPETGMQLEFTIQDLLGMMSELARKVHL
ncbi:exocyst complex component Sec3-domain-containing protein [Jimgerdemannia flammicorona]|uniref:Exocyst complex component Sec3-domain-containing protein n=1 Tax=Jimgerdemannia flammicorona TaxID=994334 RepID=A0A433Q7F8_9FUNG|nr:exocyst complex component Sec3-domain-containing protein [Jimgerdemannia flammicorona]